MDIVLDGMVDFIYSNKWMVPVESGVYLIHDLRGVLYIGKSSSLRRRYEEHLENEVNRKLKKAVMNPIGPLSFSWIQTDDYNSIEKLLIRFLKPECNLVRYTKSAI